MRYLLILFLSLSFFSCVGDEVDVNLPHQQAQSWCCRDGKCYLSRWSIEFDQNDQVLKPYGHEECHNLYFPKSNSWQENYESNYVNRTEAYLFSYHDNSVGEAVTEVFSTNWLCLNRQRTTKKIAALSHGMYSAVSECITFGWPRKASYYKWIGLDREGNPFMYDSAWEMRNSPTDSVFFRPIQTKVTY